MLFHLMCRISNRLPSLPGGNENLLMTTAEHLCSLDYTFMDLSAQGGFYPLLKILLQLSILAVPQVQAVAGAHCPSEPAGHRTKLDDPSKISRLNFVYWSQLKMVFFLLLLLCRF